MTSNDLQECRQIQGIVVVDNSPVISRILICLDICDANLSYSQIHRLIPQNTKHWPESKLRLSQSTDVTFRPLFDPLGTGDGPLEKWWRGGPKKKFMQGKIPRKKIHAKKKVKKKKFMQKEGPIVTFSESLSFRNQQYYQAQYE